jgi:hypothetical protein
MPAPAAPATSRIATTGTRDYDTWTSWEVDMAGDITGLGVYRGQGAAEVFSENFAFAGTTTTASDYVVMEPEAGAKHTGRVTTGCRITSASSGGTVRINTQHLRIDGLCILNTSNNAAVSYAIGAFVAGANDHRMTACILKAGATSATTTVLNASRSNLVFTLENTVIYGPLRTLDTRIAATVKINHVTGWRTADQIGFLCRAEATITNSYSGKASGVATGFLARQPVFGPGRIEQRKLRHNSDCGLYRVGGIKGGQRSVYQRNGRQRRFFAEGGRVLDRFRHRGAGDGYYRRDSGWQPGRRRV